MTKGSVTVTLQEINALIEDIWRAQERLTTAQRGLETLENRIAALAPDDE